MRRKNIVGRIPYSALRKDIRAVEKSEGKKFKQIPKVLVVKKLNSQGHNVVVRERKGKKVKPISSTIYITDATNKSNYAKQVARHELREVLYYQHGLDLKVNPHKKAQKYWRKDK